MKSTDILTNSTDILTNSTDILTNSTDIFILSARVRRPLLYCCTYHTDIMSRSGTVPVEFKMLLF